MVLRGATSLNGAQKGIKILTPNPKGRNMNTAQTVRLLRRIARDPHYWAMRHRIKRANNPAKSKAQLAARLAWLRTGSVTATDLRAIYNSTNGHCVYCGVFVPEPRFTPKDPRGFDHIKPRAFGGNHEKGNIVTCCGTCNAIKSAVIDHLVLLETRTNPTPQKEQVKE